MYLKTCLLGFKTVFDCFADLPCALALARALVFFGGLLHAFKRYFQGCPLTQMSAKFPKFSRPVRSLVGSFGCFRVNWTGLLLARTLIWVI